MRLQRVARAIQSGLARRLLESYIEETDGYYEGKSKIIYTFDTTSFRRYCNGGRMRLTDVSSVMCVEFHHDSVSCLLA